MVHLPLLRHTRTELVPAKARDGYPCFQLPVEVTKAYGFPIKACRQLDWALRMTGFTTPLEQA